MFDFRTFSRIIRFVLNPKTEIGAFQMKKLKTWQFILLVIFYPIGICVLIYRIWKKNKLKQERESAALARQEAKEREEAEKQAAEERRLAKIREEMRLYEDITFNIVGVTYKNPNGHSRQAMLKRLKREEYPFNGSHVDLEFKEYEFEGEPAVGVYLAGEQVGNIAKDDLPRFLSRRDRFDSCIMYDVVGGGTRDGERLKYGLRLTLRFKRADTE